MMKSFRFTFILLVVSIGVSAQDSIPVTGKLRNNLSPVSNFSPAAAYNPAAKPYTLQKGLSDLHIGYEKQTGEAGLQETGTKFDDYAIRAESYMSTGKHHIWGKASYMKKHTDNVKWNESSDYYNVYPYVFGDSLGGNNLVGEKYSFTGGYAQNLKKITWGVQLDYWALMEYRSIDPRPNNNTSNLVITAGLNYKITDRYAAGGGFLLRKYKQRNRVSFEKILGRPSTHQMTGLGTDAYWFANHDTKSFLFDGSGYGANLQFLSTDGKGISSTLAYENFSFDKQLSNNQNLVLSSIDEDKLTFDIAYLKQSDKHTIGAKIEACYTDRQGTEGKFSRVENNMLARISSEKQYKNQLTSLILTLIYENNNSQTSWYAMPYASYLNMDESHKASSNKMKVSWLEAGIKPGLSQNIKKNLIYIDGHFGYLKNIDSNLYLPGLSPQKSITQTLQANYDYLSSNAFIAGLSARFDYLLPEKNMTIYLQGNWQYRKYDDVNSNLLGITLGASF